MRAAKVPQVTLIFWVIKICATTLGETAGDAVSMSMGLGYLLGTALFAALFAMAVAMQIAAQRFKPVLYWATIIATTTVGTTLADFATRSLGIGYAGGSTLLLGLLIGSLSYWYVRLGTVSVASVATPRAEIYYWITIMFSQTLGTALGDWTADDAGFGYAGSALLFGALLAVLAALYAGSRVSRTGLFWAAFILTRPPARRGGGRPARQTSRCRWSGTQSLWCIGGVTGGNCCIVASSTPEAGRRPALALPCSAPCHWN